MSEVDRFVERLLALEVDARTLRDDPSGETWLPADLRAEVERDEALAHELAEFVATELELFDMREPTDAFFTKRVMQQLPAVEAVDDQRRTWILASAYALAIGVAYLLIGPWLGTAEFEQSLASLRSSVDQYAIEAGSAGIAMCGLLVLAALLVLPLGHGRPAAGA